MQNFYPNQYKKDQEYQINHNYLSNQFSDSEIIFEKIKDVVNTNDFTLGEAVDEVETLIACQAGTKYAIAVGSGTDAIMLSLKALNIGPGDEVITTTYTFYATIGAIVTTGAKPIFCDCGIDFNIDYKQIEKRITKKTKAIIPVHWAGRPCEMNSIIDISKKYSIPVVEDSCHALQAEFENKRCGGFGELGCFSFHPLKNLNVWGDGGIITTNNLDLTNKLKLIRNHGLKDRNTCVEFSFNSRLDTIQAVVAKHLIENKLDNITNKRRTNAELYDRYLKDIEHVNLINRDKKLKEVFHLYVFQAFDRDKLAEYLQQNGVDAKVHYPIPMHMQPAAKLYNYSEGDFPVAERLSRNSISLPVHEFITEKDIIYVSEIIKKFYN